MAKWKQIGSSTSKFYTYIAPTSSIPVLIGPGNRPPTPSEVLKALNNGDIDSLNHTYPSLGVKYDQALDAHSEEDLPPGAYYYVGESWSHPEGLVPAKIRSDSYIKRDFFHTISKDITDFLNAEDMYEDIGIQFRRGILMYGPPGEGKCLGKGTLVTTYDAKKVKVEDIKPNDLLMGDDNTPRKVLSVCSGTEQLYQVTMCNADSFIANESHILSLKYSGYSEKTKGKILDISIKDYLKLSNNKKHHLKAFTVPADFKPAEESLPIPAWILGYWLGDGHTNKPCITTMDSEVVSEFTIYCANNNLVFTFNQKKSRATTYYLSTHDRTKSSSLKKNCNNFTKGLRTLKILGDKRIPNIALRANYQTRMELLAGLIDSDGNTNRTSYDYSSVLKGLAEDVAFLARSLGFRALIKNRITKSQTGTICHSFRVRISGQGVHKIPVRIPRKQLPVRQQKKNARHFGIQIKPIGPGEYFGFTLNSNGRFLLGDFTVTHNTVLIRQLAKEIIPKDAFTIFTRTAPTRGFLEHLQKVEPNRIKVFVFEELAAALSDPWASTEAMLDFLDGETSPDKSLIIGTTNYPGMLPRNIIDRPSRFDLLIEVGSPVGKEISRIAEHYLKRDVKQIEVDALDGLSTAAIKEACILSMKSKFSIQDAAKELKARHELVLSGFNS